MKADIISIDRRIQDRLNRISVVYIKNGINHKLDMITENELTKIEIQNIIDSDN